MSGPEHDEVFDLSTETASKKTAAAGSPDELRILEAVLYASDELMTAAHLKTILPSQPDARKIRSMVEKINMQLQKERHPFEVVEIGGGYQFRTITYYHPWVRQIFKEKAAKKLSIQALECLAIIAYKQPISKAEIEAIRGVVSDGAMKTLLEKRLVTVTGRSEKPGRPLLYGTTQTFLKYFGLNRREDLPRIEEFEAMAREKMDGLSIDDLEQEEIDMKVEAVGDGETVAAAAQPPAEPGESSLFEVSLTEDTSGTKTAVEGTSNETVAEIVTEEAEAPENTGTESFAAEEESFEPPEEPVSATVAVENAPAEMQTASAEDTPETTDTTESAKDREDTGEFTIEVEAKEITPSLAPGEVTETAAVVSEEEEAFDFEAALDDAVESGSTTEKPEDATAPTTEEEFDLESELLTSVEDTPEKMTIPVEEKDDSDFSADSGAAAPEKQPVDDGAEDPVHQDSHEGAENMFELETTVANLAEIENRQPAASPEKSEVVPGAESEEIFDVGEVAADAPVAVDTVRAGGGEDTAAFEVQLPEPDGGKGESTPESDSQKSAPKTRKTGSRTGTGKKPASRKRKATGATGQTSSKTGRGKKKPGAGTGGKTPESAG